MQRFLNTIRDLPQALPETFNLARQGHSRRVLSIVHPAHYMRQVDIIYKNWSDISNACSRSALSVSKPTFAAANQEARVRATNPIPVKELSELRLSALGGYRFVCKRTSRGFSHQSIRTPFHGRCTESRRQRGSVMMQTLLGNQLDKAIRNGQDGQTVGIPVGPDASHIASEIIAAAIDIQISPKPAPATDSSTTTSYVLKRRRPCRH